MPRSVCASAFLLFLAVPLPAPVADDEILLGGNFQVDIQGAAACRDVVSFEADPIEIETTGVPRFGQARFSFRTEDAKCNEDLRSWMRELPPLGDKARRAISVILLDRRGREARRYTLDDSYPVALGAGWQQRLQLTVQIGSIRLSAPDSGGGSLGPDQPLRYKGFTVEISGTDNSPAEVDPSWESASGGADAIETIETTVDANGERRYAPGKAYVTELKLIGPMTKSRKALMTWMQNSASGKGELRRTVVITVEGPRPIDPRPAYVYDGTSIARIEIPSLNAGSSDPIKEVVVLRPTRYDDPA